MKKRFLSLVLAVIMLALLIVPASAAEEASGAPVEWSEETKDSGTVDTEALGLEEEDLIISKEVAGYIAEFFIRDITELGQSNWNDDTGIIETTLMYDETGTAVTAYTFKLTTGYVVVSAYVDIPSLILEWSDVGIPVYEAKQVESSDKIVYLSALEYYIDEGNEILKTIDGVEIFRDELVNEFEEQRSIDNINEDVLLEIIDSKATAHMSGGISAFANKKGEPITDPVEYAKNVYGGSWWSNDYANNWESSKNCMTQWDLNVNGDWNPVYTNACGPVAVVNIIKMYGNKYGNSTIKKESNKDVFYDRVIAANGNGQWKYYKQTGITMPVSDDLILESFKQYNLTPRIFGTKDKGYDLNYKNTVNALGSSTRLMYIAIPEKNSSAYPKHIVVGYAYTRLMDKNGTGRAFIKICDGISGTPRYIEIDSVYGATYWEVNFS